MKLSSYQPYDLIKINEPKVYSYKAYDIFIVRNIIDEIFIEIQKKNEKILRIENIRRASNSYINNIVKRALKNIENQKG